MNLPVINSSQFQVFSRNPNARRDFRTSWGAKTEGIKEGDYLNGIILGFEVDPKYGSKHIILKSFQHNMSQVLVWGCSSIQNELHSDQNHTIPLFHAGDVVQVTYKGSYIGKKGRSEGKLIAIFTIDEIVGYTLTQQDINDVHSFLHSQQQPKPVYTQQYTQPAPTYAQQINPYAQQNTPIYPQMTAPQPLQQPQMNPYASHMNSKPLQIVTPQQNPRVSLNQTDDDNSFDM